MFDLSKYLDSYTGIPPYASELYGVYQPLLGWQSALTKEWVRTNSVGATLRTRKILDGRIAPGPTGFGGADQVDLEPVSLRLGVLCFCSRTGHRKLDCFRNH